MSLRRQRVSARARGAAICTRLCGGGANGAARLLLSTGSFAAFASLPEKQFLAWGWQVPFLLSVVLVVIGLVVRMQVAESPVFAAVKMRGIESRVPLDRLGVARPVALTGLLLNAVANGAGVLFFARLADRVGKRSVAIGSAAFHLPFSYPFFLFIDTRAPSLIWAAVTIEGFVGSSLFAITGVLLAELFEARVRYSGISLGYQVAGMVAGAPTPIIAAALVQWADGRSWPVAIYLMAGSLLSLAAVRQVPSNS